MNQELNRLESFEGDLVKYAFSNEDESIMATLVYSTKFSDEMELRISIPGDRFSVSGHKSIMDNMTLEQVKKQVLEHLKRKELLR